MIARRIALAAFFESAFSGAGLFPLSAHQY